MGSDHKSEITTKHGRSARVVPPSRIATVAILLFLLGNLQLALLQVANALRLVLALHTRQDSVVVWSFVLEDRHVRHVLLDLDAHVVRRKSRLQKPLELQQQ